MNLENIFKYHVPFGNQAERYGKIRTILLDAAKEISKLCPNNTPEYNYAIQHLSEAMMNFNASIARNENRIFRITVSFLGANSHKVLSTTIPAVDWKDAICQCPQIPVSMVPEVGRLCIVDMSKEAVVDHLKLFYLVVLDVTEVLK